MKRSKAVLIACPSPAPYSNALFNAIAAEPGIEVDVAYIFSQRLTIWGEWKIEPGYRVFYLDAGRGRQSSALSRTCRLARLILSRKYTSVVFHGLTFPERLTGILLCVLLGLRRYLRTDSNAADPRGRFKRLRNRLLLPWLVRLCSGIITIGRRNLSFWKQFGLAQKRTYFTPYAVEDSWWRSKADQLLQERARIRREMGLQEKVVFLAAAKLSREKGLDCLVGAANTLAGSCPGLTVVIAGSGSREHSLRALVHGADVRFEGFKSQEELARYYAACDAFVLPSLYEAWGLALNEAMFFKLPLIATNVVGAVPDMLQVNKNGLVVEPGSPTALAQAMGQLYEDQDMRRRMGLESRKIIEDWDGFAQSIRGMLKALGLPASRSVRLLQRSVRCSGSRRDGLRTSARQSRLSCEGRSLLRASRAHALSCRGRSTAPAGRRDDGDRPQR